jgi:hypothetical protein
MKTKLYTPWIAWEQVSIPATGMKQSDPEEFRNSTDDELFIDRLLFDANSVTTASVRVGKFGQAGYLDSFADLRIMHNVRIMMETEDCGWPLLKLRRAVVVPAKAVFSLEILDTGNNADTFHASFIGFGLESKSSHIFSDTLTLSANGSGAMRFVNDRNEPVVITELAMFFEDTGTAALMRARRIKISGGIGQWAGDFVPMSLHFPDRNGCSYIWAPPSPLILHPGEALLAEFRDSSGSAQTVYWSAIGYRRDRRS